MIEKAVRALEFIPANNNLVFAGLENGAIQIWDVNTGKFQYTLKDPSDTAGDRVLTLAFNRNSRILYSGYSSGTVRIWQSPSGRLMSFSIRFPKP